MTNKLKTEIKTKRYRVEIDRHLCIGAGPCVEVAPKTFALDDEKLVYFLENKSPDGDDSLLLAAQACPVSAIRIYDIKTNKQVWPK